MDEEGIRDQGTGNALGHRTREGVEQRVIEGKMCNGDAAARIFIATLWQHFSLVAICMAMPTCMRWSPCLELSLYVSGPSERRDFPMKLGRHASGRGCSNAE